MTILIVEDDPIISAGLAMNLEKMGYEVPEIFTRGEEVPNFVRHSRPDLILMDIQLEGDWDGIQLAQQLEAEPFAPPIIFLTANADAAHFERAKQTQAVAFLSKPYNIHTLHFSIEQALQKASVPLATAETREEKTAETLPPDFILLKDRVFLKVKDRFVKIMLEDIWYLEAESNYTRIWTSHKEFLLSTTLKKLEGRLSAAHFMRIHRSFLVNITKIDEISESYVFLGAKQIPLARGFRDELVQRLQML